ncbi:MAG: 2OG-Fe(II) oxygenase [Gammaproteobacteria bacterium]|nr:2OG-Fe(II) oxygenase [Gammaproteobacteria bacterium]
MKNKVPIVLAGRDDLNKLAGRFRKSGRIHIPDFLEPCSAKKIHATLSNQDQWNLTWNNNGKHVDMDYTGVMNWTEPQKQQLTEIVYTQAAEGFQYYYAAIPIYDIYQARLLPGHFFNRIYEFFNSEELINFVREITGLERIKFADMQATRFSAGHFLTEHDDQVHGKNRLAAYVLNLTPNWRADWGGALVFPDTEGFSEVLFPKFNALNIFSVPQKHLVSVVSPFTHRRRYSITGWFRH